MLYTADNDPELGSWLNHNDDGKSPFVRKLIEAAKLGSPSEYTSLLPLLRRFRACDPEPGSSIRTLIRDDYKVVFDESQEGDGLDSAFMRLNAAAFENELPSVKIYYASSIQSPREPGTPLGLFAEPSDANSHPSPGQYQLDVPHIFITEKLRGVAPANEFVLLHEMCHYKVPHHGQEFIEVIRHALEESNWRVVIGGY